MTESYFIHGGTCIAFFSTEERTATISITKTEFQTAIVKIPNDSPLKLLRWQKFTQCSKDYFFMIYKAAIALNDPGKQQILNLLGFHEPIPVPEHLEITK